MTGRRDDGHRHRPVRVGRHAGRAPRSRTSSAPSSPTTSTSGALGVVSARQVDARAGRRDDLGHEAVRGRPRSRRRPARRRPGSRDRRRHRFPPAVVDHRERRDRHDRAELDDGRVEPSARRVECRHPDRRRARVASQARSLTDEADRPATPPAPPMGALGSSRTCAGTRRPATIAANVAVRPAAGQRADVRDERAVGERRRPPGWGGSARAASGRQRGRAGRGCGARPESVRCTSSLWSAADVDDADEVGALDRLRGDRDARWLAAWPREDREAEPRREHGDAAPRAAQRDGQRIVDDEAGVLGDQRRRPDRG